MSGSRRANVGKKDANELRKNGKIPCVLYGGSEQVSFSADEKAFAKLIYTPEVHTVDLDIDGKKHTAILKEVQMHPVTDKLLHVDFLEVLPGKPVTIALPVKFVGNSAGVKAGGKLVKKLRKLNVRGLVEKMPEVITIDIENLDVNQSIRVGDMNVEGLTFIDSPNVTIVSVVTTRNVAATPEEAAKAKK
ncbi:MAG: 50S ribosomal protein L25/general stress protein Ctc [Bacteroidia bacterium]